MHRLDGMFGVLLSRVKDRRNNTSMERKDISIRLIVPFLAEP